MPMPRDPGFALAHLMHEMLQDQLASDCVGHDVLQTPLL